MEKAIRRAQYKSSVSQAAGTYIKVVGALAVTIYVIRAFADGYKKD